MNLIVKVTENDELYINNEKIDTKCITPEILEKITDSKNNVTFELPNDTSKPIASLIKGIKELKCDDSYLRESLNDLLKEHTKEIFE